MVYRLEEDEVRHAGWPLRLGAAGTDEVVEAHQIRCSHYDAFRFYTPPARSLNLLQPTRETQTALEQPGCLHAGMDLYKWAYKLAPHSPSSLVMDCFDLARDIRELDMRASPYDLSDSATHRCASRPRRARRSMPPRSAASRPAARPCASGCWRRSTPCADRSVRQHAEARQGSAHRHAGPDQAVGHALDEGVPGGLDDVSRHAHGLPRGLAVGGLDEHAGDGVGAVRGIEDAHPEVDQLELVELG